MTRNCICPVNSHNSLSFCSRNDGQYRIFRWKPCFSMAATTLIPASHGQLPVLWPYLLRLCGSLLLFSSAYICHASDICLRLLRQLVRFADSFARASAGSNRAARMAIIAMTTNNSMRVNARCQARRGEIWFFILKKGFMLDGI